MSQSGVYDQTSSAPDIETLTGNSGGPVGRDGAFNVDLLAGATSGLTVVGDPGTHTLTIEALSPFYEGEVTTTDATPTTILEIPLPESTAAVVEARVVAYTAANGAGGLFSFLARRNGGNAVVIGLADYMKDVPPALAGLTFGATASGNDAIITVTGVAATTIYWKAHAELTQRSAP